MDLAVEAMEFADLVKELSTHGLPAGSVDVGGVAIDSRDVRRGDAFVAIRGTQVDGHDFVADAVARGAVAVVVDHPVGAGDVAEVVVDDTSKALASIASAFYGHPSRSLRMFGVTGTNGKTSIAHLLRRILSHGGDTYAVVGTIGHGTNTIAPATHTTPSALQLHELFRRFAEEGSVGVVMEVSSHAVRQHRTWGLDFELGILTAVTRDHLDYHSDLADYQDAKAEFCRSLIYPERYIAPGTLVYWCDDPVSRRIGEAHAGEKISVGSSEDARVRILSADATLDATRIRLRMASGRELDVKTQLLGTFAATNAALAAAAAEASGCTPENIVSALETAGNVPGRFEALGGNGKPRVIVDYAHTPDSIERVLETCRALGPEKLITVFGCGGDRDREKRPLMGAVARSLSDAVYVTADNPRTESLAAINEAIVGGMKDTDGVIVEEDRAKAIAQAIGQAGATDIVALLGKGHEDYQIIGGEKLPFDDRAQARAALEQWSR